MHECGKFVTAGNPGHDSKVKLYICDRRVPLDVKARLN